MVCRYKHPHFFAVPVEWHTHGLHHYSLLHSHSVMVCRYKHTHLFAVPVEWHTHGFTTTVCYTHVQSWCAGKSIPTFLLCH